ncbi:MarR family winged helix-turn-helix transcriptional regulator [Tepidibacter formicigenes]|jgi:DNA-binding MarR family transcriptional regulator|uniref:HTH-type transcriptional regulator SarZ n=1 Tax=Tepidibacter formicigenes DSM 15518 TaxID=1123349 RepID=A0A1M6S3B8_9FIRM|nr:MarR family transcriptional regulator [Tepidibacter formicigenes]SHK38998.1 DNA-binding transcriptional regulator, MarR family [Tepidibacter formicigenes DSM 15518]
MSLERYFLEISEYLLKLDKQYLEKMMDKNEFSKLSMNHMCYLEAIYELKGPTFSELAQELDVSRPSVTTMIRKLSNQDYVKRVRSNKDGREYHIYLTEKGKKIVKSEQDACKYFTDKIKKFLNESELENLSIILGKIVKNI